MQQPELRALVQQLEDPNTTDEERALIRAQVSAAARRDFAFPGQRRKPSAFPAPGLTRR